MKCLVGNSACYSGVNDRWKVQKVCQSVFMKYKLFTKKFPSVWRTPAITNYFLGLYNGPGKLIEWVNTWYYGVFSTSADVQYIGGCSVHRRVSVHRGVFSTSGGYLEYIGVNNEYIGGVQYIGGCHEYIGGISGVHRGMFSTSGDIMSTSGFSI